jgi:hypothetical protein
MFDRLCDESTAIGRLIGNGPSTMDLPYGFKWCHLDRPAPLIADASFARQSQVLRTLVDGARTYEMWNGRPIIDVADCTLRRSIDAVAAGEW